MIRIFCAFFLFVAPLSAEATADVSVANGKEIYLIHCVKCHGERGEGDGVAADRMPRPPRDFTEGIYKIKTSRATDIIVMDDDLFDTISRGMSAAGMPPWKDVLTVAERWQLVAYIKSLAEVFAEEDAPQPLDLSDPVPYSPGSVARGKKAFFKLKCFECHGETGSGPSIKELKDDYGKPITPRDLTKPWQFIGPYTPKAIYARLTNGIPLTPMPAFRNFGADDQLRETRWDLVNYLKLLNDEAKVARAKRQTITLILIGIVVLVGLALMRPYLTQLLR